MSRRQMYVVILLKPMDEEALQRLLQELEDWKLQTGCGAGPGLNDDEPGDTA